MNKDKSTWRRLAVSASTDKPKYSYADMLEHRNAESLKLSDEIAQRRKLNASESIAGRSGILPIHTECSFDNYNVTCQGQHDAMTIAKNFADKFNLNNGKSFVFSGDVGTGKNHLAAAICNQLMRDNKTCLVITVSELMMRLNSCYGESAKMTEEKFHDGMVKIDLLIIDEIGVGRTSVNAANNERLAINQIIDKRLCHLKPTGILTNLGQKDINDNLGPRIMDRLRNDGGQWVKFNWPSHRSQ